MTRNIRKLLDKSKDSALLAVEIYNKPRTSFRSFGYIVLMQIAWIALFQAVFEKNGINYYCKKSKTRYKKSASGDKMAWCMADCVKEYYKNDNAPERKNLEFFIGFRDKIEHRFLPEIDSDIFGECQAMLMNYENILAKEFGPDESINENLVFSLQFSRILNESQQLVIKKRQTLDYIDVASFVSKYRKGLRKDVWSSLRYNFRVYLIPKIANHATSADFALEFVKLGSTNRQNINKVGSLIAAIKEVNILPDTIKPSDVAKRVYKTLKDSMPADWKFTVSSHHVRCWKYYKIRPKTGSQQPNKTVKRYCHYFAMFNEYGYTEQWVKFIIKKLSNPTEYKKIMTTK
jgi:hypothetical protein